MCSAERACVFPIYRNGMCYGHYLRETDTSYFRNEATPVFPDAGGVEASDARQYHKAQMLKIDLRRREAGR